MTTAVSTMDGPTGTAVRIDVRPIAEQEPWLVDEWLFTPVCGHPDCQVVVTMGSLDPARNATPVEGVLVHYSHMLTVRTNQDGHKWTPTFLDKDVELTSVTVFTNPIAVADDQAARAICHLLVRDIVADVIPAQPVDRTERATWQLAVLMALLANQRPVRGARLDPGVKRAEGDGSRDLREPGFPVGRAAAWVGQEPDKERDREHG